MYLRKAHIVEGLILCTLCAFSREANAIASVTRTSVVLVGSGGRFVPPTAAPFPDGVGDGLVCRLASHCRSQCVKLQMRLHTLVVMESRIRAILAKL